MRVELKNVKLHQDMSEETACFSATLWIDGKKAATVSNHGTGGCNNFHFPFSDHKVEEAFNAYCASLPPLPGTKYDDGFEAPPLKMDADLYVSQLLEQWETRKWLKSQCRNKTLFRLKGDKAENWRIAKNKFNSDVKAAIIKHFGDKVEEFANETI